MREVQAPSGFEVAKEALEALHQWAQTLQLGLLAQVRHLSLAVEGPFVLRQGLLLFLAALVALA